MLALIFCALPFNGLAKEPIEISLVALEDDPPFSFVEKEQSKGVLIELMAEVSEALPDYKITIQHRNFEQIQARDLPENTLGFLGAYYRINEWDDVYPYSYSIFHEQLCIVCRNDALNKRKERKWPDDFASITLGTIRNYSGWETVGVEQRKAGKMRVFELPSPDVALKSLSREFVDCVVMEKTVFHAYLAELVEDKRLPKEHGLYIASDLDRDSLHIAYFERAINEQNSRFIKDFDKAFASLLLNKKLNHIFEKYGVRY